jgi:hypothetical protein
LFVNCFSQIQPSTLDFFEIEFCNFFLFFFMKLPQSYDPCREFNKLL